MGSEVHYNEIKCTFEPLQILIVSELPRVSGLDFLTLVFLYEILLFNDTFIKYIVLHRSNVLFCCKRGSNLRIGKKFMKNAPKLTFGSPKRVEKMVNFIGLSYCKTVMV